MFHGEQRRWPFSIILASMIDPLVRWMENKVNKSMLIVASALVAVATTWVPAAQAKGGGGGGHHSGGSGMKFASAPSSHNHTRVFRRDSYVASGYKAEEARERRAKLATLPAAAIVRYTDGKGRVYDLASKAWCDGNNHCWTGKDAWTFKDGAWFYGASRWYEADGVWRTDAAEAPALVDCETLAAFAKLKPTTELQIASRPDDDQTGQPKDTSEAASPIKMVETAPAGAMPTECKKYFPSVGETLPVPCEG
jgi:hypothetical protein